MHVHVHAMRFRTSCALCRTSLHPLSKMLAKHWNSNRSQRPAY